METIVPLARKWGSLEARVVGARQGWRCNVCQEVLPATFELDHVVPLFRGGSNDIETNAAALCTSCHATKTLHENIDRHNRLFAQRRAAVEAARAAAPPEPRDPWPKASKRKPAPPDLTDPVVDANPFLKYAFVPYKPDRRTR